MKITEICVGTASNAKQIFEPTTFQMRALVNAVDLIKFYDLF
jgi:hypothetical protein